MKIIINELKSDRTLPAKSKGKIRKAARLALINEKKAGTISITFADDVFIRRLNKKYRGLDRVTDVLSFVMNEEGLLGDIVISLDTAYRNSKRYKEKFDKEIIRLVVHGALHLLNYDHVKKSERSRFLKKQEETLKLI